MLSSASCCSVKDSACCSFPSTRATARTKNWPRRIGTAFAQNYRRTGRCAFWRLPTGNSGRWMSFWEKSARALKPCPINCCFFDAASVVTWAVRWTCGGRSVSERRFPPSHSAGRASSARSVSERRFPPSHSEPLSLRPSGTVYLSDDSRQATARISGSMRHVKCI